MQARRGRVRELRGGGQSYAALADGAHTFAVRARDVAGNVDGSPATYAWTIDTTAPVTTITSSPSNPATTGAAAFTYSASEPGASFQCKLDAAAFAACATTGQSYAGLAEGSHTFQVRAIDSAGNVDATPASFAWTIDTVAPVTAITSNPSNPATTGAAAFTYSASEPGATFECKLDAGAFASCAAAGQSYAALADGAHTFAVRARDVAGNVDGSPATYAWTIDTTAPVTTITSNPSNPATTGAAAFTYSASEPGASFQCKLDAAAFAACATTGQSYSGLADGSHTFQVRAIDSAGNVDATPASFAWTIDTVPPVATITATPTDPSASATATFAYSANESGATFTCRLDAAATFTACPASYTGLTDGSHTFRVRATDPAGNVGVAAVFTWTIDTVAPIATITATPPDPSASATAVFAYSANEIGATFTCRLDAAATFTACPASYTGLTDGSHTFRVRATDPAGNIGAAAVFTWTIDTTPPNTTVATATTTPTTATSAAFTYTSTEAGSTFQCKLDTAAFGPCATTGQSYSGLADGAHTFQVRAIDSAGNVDPTPATFAWTVDTAPPDTTVATATTTPTTATGASFTYTSTEPGASFQCKLDTAAFGPCATTGQSYSGLADGAHTFQVRAVDGAGNVDPTPASFAWTVDTVAPVTTITTAPTDPSASATATFAYSANEPGSTFTCRFDAAATFTACPASYAGLTDGAHTFRVRATDPAGNIGAAAVFTWTVDTIAPVTTITTAPADPSASATATFAYSANEAGSTFACRFDAAATFTACPVSYTGLTDGSHTFRVRATDPAGNIGAAAVFTWTVDTVAPVTTITATPSDPSASAAATFAYSANEIGSTFTCRLDAAATFTACPASYSGLTDGSHTFRVRATDPAGNIGVAAVFTWTVDTTAPTISIVSTPANPSAVANATFTYGSNDAAAAFECKLDTAPVFSACASTGASYTNLASSAHTFQVRARDAAGNVSAALSFGWTVNTAGPTLAQQPPAGWTVNYFTFTFNPVSGATSYQCNSTPACRPRAGPRASPPARRSAARPTARPTRSPCAGSTRRAAPRARPR